MSKRSTYTTCYQRYKKANDGSTKEDYFFYRMTLSGYALKGNVTTKMWVEPKPTTTGMSWYTSDPFEPDSTTTASSGCVTVSASIGGGEVPASLGASTDICNKEQFTFKLYNDAGHHAGVLTANCIPANSGRKVYATALVKTTQNNVAGWSTAYRGMDVRTVVAGC